MSIKVEVVSPAPVALGEGPHWDVKKNALHYVDIFGGSVHLLDPVTKVDTECKVGGYASFAIPRSDDSNELVIGHNVSIEILNWSSKKIKAIANVDQDKPADWTRLNDAKCDAFGRLWTGSMHRVNTPDLLKSKQGTLYSLDGKHKLQKRLPDVSISNGTTWSHDNKIMYYIDSTPLTVTAYDFDLATGDMSNGRTVIDFKTLGEEFGLPDGMTIDNAGKLWIACYSGSRVIHCDPETGKLLQVVKLPTANTTSCCFGGPNFTDLYVTSCHNFLSDEELRAQPMAGRVFKLSGLAVGGKADYTFSG